MAANNAAILGFPEKKINENHQISTLGLGYMAEYCYVCRLGILKNYLLFLSPI
jgi:hypothetical protein